MQNLFEMVLIKEAMHANNIYWYNANPQFLWYIVFALEIVRFIRPLFFVLCRDFKHGDYTNRK